MNRHPLLFLLLAVLACSPTAELVTTTSSPSITEVTPTTPPVDEPFEYRVGMLSDVNTLNPWAAYDSKRSPWTSYVVDRTTAGLYRPVMGAIATVPDLAAGEVAEPVETETGWSVEVDVDGTWSDGAPVSAFDVAFTFETVRALDLGREWVTWFPEIVVDIEVVDDDTATIWFSERPGLSVWPFAVGVAPILPEHFWGDTARRATTKEELYSVEPTDQPTGGPFSISKRTPGEEIRLDTNPHWSQPPPNASGVTYAVYETLDLAMAALASGEIDAFIDPDGVDPQLSSTINAPIGYLTSETNGFRFLAFNLNRPVTGNLGFRTALGLLVDRADVGADPPLVGGGVSVPRQNLAWYVTESADAILGPGQADPLGAAVASLRSAGFSWATTPTEGVKGEGASLDGVPVTPLELLAPTDDAFRLDFAERIAAVLDDLGFEAVVRSLPLADLVNEVFTPIDGEIRYDMYLAGWRLGSPSFPTYHAAFWARPTTVRGQRNNTGFDSDEFERLLDGFSTTRDPGEAREIMWQLEGILAAEKPYLFLYTEQIHEVIRSDRVGFPFASNLGGIQAGGGFPELVEPAS